MPDDPNVGLSTIRDFEKGRHTPISNNLTAIQGALEAGGITFLADGQLAAGQGVSLRVEV
nr:transcriptional regulator [Rhizobium sp. IE4771]